MGAWGHTTFENDDALDWWETFRDRPTRDMLERTFVFISEAGNDEFIEAPECGAAIAAAEIVAALRGSPATNLPEDIVAWLSLPQELNIDNEIVEIALASLARISISSELTDLWKESDEFDAWRGAVKDLNDRLLLSVSAS